MNHMNQDKDKEKQKCSAPLTHRMISYRLPQVSVFYEARIRPSYHKCKKKFNNEFYRHNMICSLPQRIKISKYCMQTWENFGSLAPLLGNSLRIKVM